jgi:hypothetical protein
MDATVHERGRMVCRADSIGRLILGWTRGRLRGCGERGQAVVEYGGLLVLVAAIIGALSTFGSSGVAGYISSGVQHLLCEINLGSVGGSCPNTASPGATSGSQSASLRPSGADIRQAEQKAFGSTRLVDACAGGPSASSLAAQRAPTSAACKAALAELSPHDQAVLAVVAAALQANQPSNQGNFFLLLQSYLRDPAYAVIALSPRAQQEQANGNNLLSHLQAHGGDLWDGLLGSLCGGYGICLGGDVLAQSYQQAYHSSASIARITSKVALVTGVAAALKDLALSGVRAALIRFGASGSDAQRAEQAVEELEGGAGAAGSGRGGIGPVQKGQAGVGRAIGELEAQGYTVTGTEVTIQTPVGRVRVDVVAKDQNGNLIFEVKNGPSARVSPNQQRVFAYIREHGGTPVGANAENAGLPAGQPISPTPVRVIHFR